ncbi:GDP-mannose-dependent alpha-(1-2)-phosphatidylinositol mannosyltransferase [Clostridium sp. C105KSO15]|nr:GDP-mannose-dependent alpha-(1-2)-phosphatidylinositol mannosyltransferase [Clostridium sp. C105KSO15]
MKKILHISKYYYPFIGGIEQTARDCVNALSGEYEQMVVCFNHEKGDQISTVDGVKVIRCACQLKVASQSLSIGMVGQLRRTIEKFAPDYILIHYPNPFASEILLSALPLKTKLVLYWHLDITKQKILGKVFHLQNRRLINRADVIIATSPNYIEGSKYLSFVKEKCVVIPSCINEGRLRVGEEATELANVIKKENKNKIICLAVGRHVPYKGFEYLIRAGKMLDSRFEIYITGKGELTQKLKELASDNPHIHFLGAVDDTTLKAYYIASDIFCFPSITKNEAFGLALAEAMYFGKPAVTFTIPGSGVNYVSVDGQTGFEVENRNVKEYANALQKLANDEQLRLQLGCAARERVNELFLLKQYKDNIQGLFRKF